MDAPSDRDLILHARRGEAGAYGELVERHQKAVFNACYRILHDRSGAEDMAQETFLRAHARLGGFDLERPFGPWIRRVAVNVCLNHLESLRTEAALDDERDAGEDGRPEAVIEEREQGERIRAALASLPVHYRAVVELRHFQNLSYGEIAAELGIPLSDVKSHLFRARKLLAEKLHAAE